MGRGASKAITFPKIWLPQDGRGGQPAGSKQTIARHTLLRERSFPPDSLCVYVSVPVQGGAVCPFLLVDIRWAAEQYLMLFGCPPGHPPVVQEKRLPLLGLLPPLTPLPPSPPRRRLLQWGEVEDPEALCHSDLAGLRDGQAQH